MGFAASILLGGPYWPTIIDSQAMIRLAGSHGYIGIHNSMGNIYFFAPAVSLLILVLIGFLNRNPSERRTFIAMGLICAPIMLVIGGITFPYSLEPIRHPSNYETKLNLHIIQHALELYAEKNNGLYPESIGSLLGNALKTIPKNAYQDSPFMFVPYGSPDFKGNFTYLPLKINNEVRGYYLLAYGNEYDVGAQLFGLDIADHVIMVLDSETSEKPTWPDNVPFPDIRDVIIPSWNQSGIE
jgi:hypothetical protein